MCQTRRVISGTTINPLNTDSRGALPRVKQEIRPCSMCILRKHTTMHVRMSVTGTLMGTSTLQSNRLLYTNTVIGTMAVDW